MAQRGVSLNPGYRSGSHWAVCDQCTGQFRAEDLQETWDHFWVCDEDFESRHPQDFLRVRAETITVQQPIRLDNTDNIVSTSFQEGANGYSAVAGLAVAGLSKCGKDRNDDMQIPEGTFNILGIHTAVVGFAVIGIAQIGKDG